MFAFRHEKSSRLAASSCVYVAGLPVEHPADAHHAAGIDVTVLPNGKHHGLVDSRKKKVEGNSVVAVLDAVGSSLFAESLSQALAAPVMSLECCAVADQGVEVAFGVGGKCHGRYLLKG